MSDKLISEITLEYLMNKEQYGKYINTNSPNVKESARKDKRFYRKRIYDLTKQLLSDEPQNQMYFDVKFSFEIYIKSCIEYFKGLDKSDTIQEDYVDFANIDKLNDIDTININDVNDVNDANKLMMRSITILEPNSLEKLVKRTSTKKQKPPFIPIQKDINLKDPNFKNKGIRKKKNITNKYDETETIKKEDENKKI